MSNIQMQENEIHLFAACWNGDARVAARILTKRKKIDVDVLKTSQVPCPNINVDKNDEATPLFVASRRGHSNVVKTLIVHNADVNFKKKGEVSSLYIASQEGHADVIAELVKAGADVNCALQSGATPLFIAAQFGHTDVVNLLLECGAGVNIGRRSGGTPLYVAAQNGYAEVVELLVDAKAYLYAARKVDGGTAITIAAWEGHKDVIKTLLDHGMDINKSEDSKETALMNAAAKGHLETVQFLLDKGANSLLTTEKHSRSALDIAENQLRNRGGTGEPERIETMEKIIRILRTKMSSLAFDGLRTSDFYCDTPLDVLQCLVSFIY